MIASSSSIPALALTLWYASNAHSNMIFISYGGALFIAALAVPVWIVGLFWERKSRKRMHASISDFPYCHVLYPVLLILFFILPGFVHELQSYNNVGLRIGSYAWLAIVISTFLLVTFYPAPKVKNAEQAGAQNP